MKRTKKVTKSPSTPKTKTKASASLAPASTVKATSRRTLRALGGRRIVIEGFGGSAPTFVAISGGNDVPTGAWLSSSQLRRLVETARRILK